MEANQGNSPFLHQKAHYTYGTLLPWAPEPSDSQDPLKIGTASQVQCRHFGRYAYSIHILSLCDSHSKANSPDVDAQLLQLPYSGAVQTRLRRKHAT